MIVPQALVITDIRAQKLSLDESFNFSLQSEAVLSRVPMFSMKISVLAFITSVEWSSQPWRPFEFFKVFDFHQNVRPCGVQVSEKYWRGSCLVLV